MKTLWIGLRAVTFMTGFLAMWAWLIQALRPLDAKLGWALYGWLAWMAPVPLAQGAFLVLACAGLFVVRGRGTPALFDSPRRFVAAGPYRFVRNPMYVGALLLLLGLGLYWRSGVTVLLALPAFVLAHLLVVLYEEPVLRRKFGAEYELYLRHVNRWIPCAVHGR